MSELIADSADPHMLAALSHMVEVNKRIENSDIDAVSLYMLENMDLVDVPISHSFVPRMYIREMKASAGTLIVGKTHLTEDPYVLLSGSKLMFTESGGTVVLYGGHSGVTKPGTRRVGFILEDCRWINYHALTPEEEEFRVSGGNENELIAMIEDRIFEEMDALPNKDGKTVHELYQERLREVLICQE
jgi:hypothetical protein